MQSSTDPQTAALLYRQAIALRPDYAEAYNNLGLVYTAQGKFKMAAACYQKATEVKPDYAVAFFNLGVCLAKEEKYSQAVACYEKAIQLDPGFTEAYLNLAGVSKETGKLDAAIGWYRKLLQRQPDCVIAHVKNGHVHAGRGCWSLAEEHYRAALDKQPDHREALFALSSALQEQANFEAAIKSWQKVIALQPSNVKAYYNLANIFIEQQRLEEAVRLLERAIEIKPDYYQALANLGNAYQGLGQLEASILAHRKALEFKDDVPEMHINLSMSLLLAGRFKEGWEEYEWRIELYKYPRFENRLWDGRAYPGKTLYVHEEQGFGDTLMFCRYLPQVKSLGGRLVFEVRRPLAELFKNFPGIDELIVLPDDTSKKLKFNRYLPLLSIARVFGTTLKNIPADIPYLFADRQKAARYQQVMASDGLKVGIVWEGSRKHTNDRLRSTKLEHFKVLLKKEAVTFFSLQKEVSPDDENLLRIFQISNLGRQFTDFSDTAAAIENLDLLISVDTSVAHLAGAMGKPVWLLLPFIPDWRWLMGREDSPWYPNMRLFRQKKRGGWEGVFEAVARNFEQWILKGK